MTLTASQQHLYDQLMQASRDGDEPRKRQLIADASDDDFWAVREYLESSLIDEFLRDIPL